jgi:hypothetical protein
LQFHLIPAAASLSSVALAKEELPCVQILSEGLPGPDFAPGRIVNNVVFVNLVKKKNNNPLHAVLSAPIFAPHRSLLRLRKGVVRLGKTLRHSLCTPFPIRASEPLKPILTNVNFTLEIGRHLAETLTF